MGAIFCVLLQPIVVEGGKLQDDIATAKRHLEGLMSLYPLGVNKTAIPTKPTNRKLMGRSYQDSRHKVRLYKALVREIKFYFSINKITWDINDEPPYIRRDMWQTTAGFLKYRMINAQVEKWIQDQMNLILELQTAE